MRTGTTGITRLSAALVWAMLAVGVVLIGVAGSVPAIAQSVEVEPSVAEPLPGLHIVRSDANGVVLELFTPEYQLKPVETEGRAFEQLTVPNLNKSSEAGWPQLPLASALLGVPADARVSVRILSDEVQAVAGLHSLAPAPTPVLSGDEDLQPGEWRFTPDTAAYARSTAYPDAVARVADDAWLRDQRLVRVELYPFQYQPLARQLTWHRRLRIEVLFERTGDRAYKSVAASETPFDGVLRNSLLNYEQARDWRAAPVTAAKPTVDLTPRTKIVVDHDGLYRSLMPICWRPESM